MRPLSLAATAALAIGLAASGCTKGSDNLTLFQADLAGANEFPVPRSTGASGRAGFSLDGDRVTYTIEIQGTIRQAFAAHIHSGAAGVNGLIRVTLYPGPDTADFSGVLISGSFTAANVTGVTFEQLLNEMRAGTAYVNVHTRQYSGGEIRGQVRLVTP
jgi:CHRD domain